MPNRLRERIDIVARDASGQIDLAHPLYAGVWASVEDLGGRRLEQAQLLEAETTHRFVIRYIPNMQSDVFVVFDQVTYYVDYIRDPGYPMRRRYLELLAHKVRDGV